MAVIVVNMKDYIFADAMTKAIASDNAKDCTVERCLLPISATLFVPRKETE